MQSAARTRARTARTHQRHPQAADAASPLVAPERARASRGVTQPASCGVETPIGAEVVGQHVRTVLSSPYDFRPLRRRSFRL